MIVLGSRAAGKRASRVNAVPFSFCRQTSAPDGATSSVHIDLERRRRRGHDAPRGTGRAGAARPGLVGQRRLRRSRRRSRRDATARLGRGSARAQHWRAPGLRRPACIVAAGRSTCRPSEVRELVRDQVAALAAVAAERGARLDSRQTAWRAVQPGRHRFRARPCHRARRARCRPDAASRRTVPLAVARRGPRRGPAGVGRSVRRPCLPTRRIAGAARISLAPSTRIRPWPSRRRSTLLLTGFVRAI